MSERPVRKAVAVARPVRPARRLDNCLAPLPPYTPPPHPDDGEWPVGDPRREDYKPAEVVQADLFALPPKAPGVDYKIPSKGVLRHARVGDKAMMISVNGGPPAASVEIKQGDSFKLVEPQTPGRPPCPACGASDPKVRSVEGGSRPNLLKTRWECRECDHVWPTEKERTDACEHGVVKFVPCAACGRTWDSIFAGPDYRAEFHPRGKVGS